MHRRAITAIIITLAACTSYCQKPAVYSVEIVPHSMSISVQFVATPAKAEIFRIEISNNNTNSVLLSEPFKSYDQDHLNTGDSCLIKKTFFYSRFEPGIADTVLQLKLMAKTGSEEQLVFLDDNLRLPPLQQSVIRQARRFMLSGCHYEVGTEGIDITVGFGDPAPDAGAREEAQFKVFISDSDSSNIYESPLLEMSEMDASSSHLLVPYYSISGNPGHVDGTINIQFYYLENHKPLLLLNNHFPIHTDIPQLYRFDEQKISIRGSSATKGQWQGEAAISFKASYHMEIPMQYINRMDEYQALGHSPVYYFYVQVLYDSSVVYEPLRGAPGTDYTHQMGIQEYGEYAVIDQEHGGRDGVLEVKVPLGGVNLDPDDYDLKWQFRVCDEKGMVDMDVMKEADVAVRMPKRFLYAMQINELDAASSSADAGKLLQRNRPVDPKYYVFLNNRRVYRSAMCQNCGNAYRSTMAFTSTRTEPLQLVVYDDDVLRDDFLGRYRFNTRVGMIMDHKNLQFDDVDLAIISLNLQNCGSVGPIQLDVLEDYKHQGISGVVISGRMAECEDAPKLLLRADYKGRKSLSYHIPGGMAGLQGTQIGNDVDGESTIIPAQNSGFSFFIPYATMSHDGMLRLKTRVSGHEGHIVPDQVIPVSCKKKIRDVRYQFNAPQLTEFEGKLGYVLSYDYRCPEWYRDEQASMSVFFDTALVQWVHVVPSGSDWERALNPVPATKEMNGMMIRSSAVFIPLTELQQAGAYHKFHIVAQNTFGMHTIGLVDTLIRRPMKDLTCFQLISFEATRKKRFLRKSQNGMLAIKVSVDGKVIDTKTIALHEALDVNIYFTKMLNMAIIKGQEISVCCYIDMGTGYQAAGSARMGSDMIKAEGALRLKCGKKLRKAALHYKNCSLHT